MTDVLDNFCVLSEEREMKLLDENDAGLHISTQWTVSDPALKRRIFYAAHPSSLSRWSELDPALEVREMNAALA